MTKAQLIERMAKDAGISKAEAGKAFDSLFDSIVEAHSPVWARFQRFIAKHDRG